MITSLFGDFRTEASGNIGTAVVRIVQKTLRTTAVLSQSSFIPCFMLFRRYYVEIGINLGLLKMISLFTKAGFESILELYLIHFAEWDTNTF